jgi:hypothetical protein
MGPRVSSPDPDWLADLRTHWKEHKQAYFIAASIVGALLLAMAAVLLLYHFWWSAPAVPPAKKSESEPGVLLGLLVLVGLFFLVRALLRGTLQLYSTVAYLGLFVLIVLLVSLAVGADESAQPYLAGGVALAVVLGAFVEIGNRIAFRLSEINGSLQKIKQSVDKAKNSALNDRLSEINRSLEGIGQRLKD